MKSCLLVSTAAAVLCTLVTSAYAANDPKVQIIAGYRQIDAGRYSFTHNTHPDDSFLSKAKVAGSAGTTSVDGSAGAALFALRYTFANTESTHFSVEGGVVTTTGRPLDRHQNANDTRPAATAAFVYSQMEELGYYAAGSVTFDLTPDWYVGVQGEWIGIRFSSGWDRFSAEQQASSTLKSLPAANLKLGYRIANGFGVEALAGYGQSPTYGAQVTWGF